MAECALKLSLRVGEFCGALKVALVAMLLPTVIAFTQDPTSDWQQQVRSEVKNQQLDAALERIERRLADDPVDLEAHAWHGRVLAWKGRWADAETEFRHVIEQAPDDTEILAELSDVLLWQRKLEEALFILDRASSLAPHQAEIRLRRARVLLELGRTDAAKNEIQQVLASDPENAEARLRLSGLTSATRHELRVGVDVDTFNYTDPAQAESLTLGSRWSKRWSTLFGTSFFQRFGENPEKFIASTAFRFTRTNWLNVGGAVAPNNSVIPKNEAFCEYGHGFQFDNSWIRGLETSYQQHWFWYRGAHVLTLSLAQIYYLPHDWTWVLTVTGARNGFAGTRTDWVPSGSSRLGFPVLRRLNGSLIFAVGSEDFAEVDQIGRFSAHTFGGGLRYHFTSRQDLSVYFAYQLRTQGRVQDSFGLSYGVRF
jgi:Tfp pilus assembly protein PilF